MSEKRLETPAPPPARLLTMEIECFHRKIKELEGKSYREEEVALYRAEIVLRIDLYRLSTSVAYTRISDVPRIDKMALVKLFESLGGHSWKRKFGWTGQSQTSIKPAIGMFEAEAQLFDGVETSDKTVTALKLTNNACEGELPGKIGDLSNLTTLYIDINNLEGSLPHGLGRLEKLEFVNLSCNNLGGEIDERCLTKLRTLRILDLSFNKMTGELPDCFDSVTKLQDLNLSGNSFEGALPNSMATLVNLRNLKMYSNNFSGPLPRFFMYFTNLLTINMSQNKFTGGLNQLFSCVKLKRISLSNNLLTEPLDGGISALQSLELLYLNGNSIGGRIPVGICNLKFLKFINLSDNELVGALPEEFGNMSWLKLCTLSNNRLCGPIPSTISKLVNLRDFHIFTSSKSETMSLQRAFTKHLFDRVYCWGTSVGIDNVTWELPTMDDIGNVFAAKKKPKSRSEYDDEDSESSDEDS